MIAFLAQDYQTIWILVPTERKSDKPSHAIQLSLDPRRSLGSIRQNIACGTCNN